MKNYLLFSFISASLLFTACGPKKETLKVAATPTPHAELLSFIKSDLEQEGVFLEILEIEDYNLPNRSLSEGQINANFFQHIPFLEAQIQEFSYRLKSVAKIHIEPMGIYSSSLKNIKEVSQGAKVTIPSDPSNEERALQLLEKAGLITLKRKGNQKSTILDIAENPKNLQILEIDAALLPRSLQDASLAVIPANFAIQAHFSPTKDSLFLEDKDTKYANVIVVQDKDEEREDIKKLIAWMTSEKMKNHILEKYHGAILPAF